MRIISSIGDERVSKMIPKGAVIDTTSSAVSLEGIVIVADQDPAKKVMLSKNAELHMDGYGCCCRNKLTMRDEFIRVLT